MFTHVSILLNISCVLRHALEDKKVGRASRDSAGFGAMEEGLISRGDRKFRLPTLQVDSLPAEPPGKPTEV